MTLLYHGSNIAIEQIDLSRSKRGKDFGQEFYLNADPIQGLALLPIIRSECRFEDILWDISLPPHWLRS